RSMRDVPAVHQPAPGCGVPRAVGSDDDPDGMGRRLPLRLLGPALTGALLAALALSAAAGNDRAELALIAGGAAGVVGLAGAAALSAFARRPLSLQASAVALTAVTAVAGGAWA